MGKAEDVGVEGNCRKSCWMFCQNCVLVDTRSLVNISWRLCSDCIFLELHKAHVIQTPSLTSPPCSSVESSTFFGLAQSQ